MRTITVLVLLVGLSQSAWARWDGPQQVEESVEEKPPINPDNPGGPPAYAKSGTGAMAADGIMEEKPPINPDNPGGPPVPAATGALPETSSPLPLVGVVSVLFLLAAGMLRIWRYRLEKR